MKSLSAKRGYFVFFFLLILVGNVFAQNTTEQEETPLTQTLSSTSDLSESYDWVLNTSLTTTPSAFDQSFAILALVGKTGRSRDLGSLVQRVLEQKDQTDNCWPTGQCTTQDTALAVLALKKAGSTGTDTSVTWLKEALQSGLRTSGEWRIQIETKNSGACTLSWGENRNKEFQIAEGKLQGTASQHYISVSTDLRDSSLLSNPNSEIRVDCSALGSDISGTGIVISLIYAKSSTELYLLESTSGGLAGVTLSNGCFGQEQQSTRCDYLSTLYTTWALLEAGEKFSELGTHTYLESNLGTDDLHKAILVRSLLVDSTLSSTSFVQNLANAQRPGDGSWKSGDITTTAWATLALSKSSEYTSNVQNGQLYLQRKIEDGGSWDNDLQKTSLALLALRGDLNSGFVSTNGIPSTRGTSEATTERICNDILDNDEDSFLDCGDADCLDDENCRCENQVLDTGEDGIDCGGLCPKTCTGTTTPVQTDECVENTDCSEGEECKFGRCVTTLEEVAKCSTDSECADGEICESQTCVPEPESNFGTLLLILLLLLLIGGGVFFYFKYIKTGKISLFKKKDKGLSFEQFKQTLGSKPKPQEPQRTFTMPRTTNPTKKNLEDEELEKSLKEAEKLLKQ